MPGCLSEALWYLRLFYINNSIEYWDLLKINLKTVLCLHNFGETCMTLISVGFYPERMSENK